MAAKAMWEVDPETRSKLQAIQKESQNSICCDCSAPSPQWASPKFGIFICLSCAGVHRGLGVHISFVRSISMDAFKANEIERMRLGGNARWREFFDAHAENREAGLAFGDVTIAERYGGAVGEEWKERLSAKVEGREFVAMERKGTTPTGVKAVGGGKIGGGGGGGGAGVGLEGSREGSPVVGGPGQGGKAKVDDRYFARLGADNASRPDGLPPSQGGKYGGFGNTPMPDKKEEAAPTLDDLQTDPVAALTKGFGWFTTTVTKTAKTVNDGYIQPTAAKLAESELAKQAQLTAAQLGRTAQQGARTANDGFLRFVEGQQHGSGGSREPLDPNRRDFWDDFSSLADNQKETPRAGVSSSIGTAAMGKGSSSRSGGPMAKKQDDWDDW